VCRRPRRSDEPSYRALLQHPDVHAWLRPPPLPPFDDAQVAERLEHDVAHWHEHGFGPWALIDRRTGAYAGRGGLAWTTVAGERAVELPWSIVPERWGDGLATEAAGAALETAVELGLQPVVSFTLTHNAGSRRVMEKLGLAYAGEIEHAGLPHVLYRATGSADPPR